MAIGKILSYSKTLKLTYKPLSKSINTGTTQTLQFQYNYYVSFKNLKHLTNKKITIEIIQHFHVLLFNLDF